MLLKYIGIFRWETNPNKGKLIPTSREKDARDCIGHLLWEEADVSQFNYFVKGSAKEISREAARTVLESGLIVDTPDTCLEKGKRLFRYSRKDGLAVIIIAEPEYTPLAGLGLLKTLLDDFSSKHPRSQWATGDSPPQIPYQFHDPKGQPVSCLAYNSDPENANKLENTQKMLDDITITMRDSVAALLERGEKLDSLIAKSDNLSTQSKAFYSQARKQNSCCIMM